VDIETEKIPFPDEYFDLVTSIETLEHLYSPLKALKEISRVLKPLGLFYMTAPNPIYKDGPAFRDPTHVSVFTKNSG